jgi:DNA-binding HxlR family transcriptional regulator
MELDKRIHEPVRLRIMAHLIADGPSARFNELKQALGLTQGNLASHLKVLERAGFVAQASQEADPYACHIELTQTGREAFVEYLGSLNEVLSKLSGS